MHDKITAIPLEEPLPAWCPDCNHSTARTVLAIIEINGQPSHVEHLTGCPECGWRA